MWWLAPCTKALRKVVREISLVSKKKTYWIFNDFGEQLASMLNVFFVTGDNYASGGTYII